MSDLKVFAKTVEQEALDQVGLLLAQPAFSNCKVRIMPDVHAGKGCVIGFTADLGDKVIPNIVGVDIGCGVRVVELGNTSVDFGQLDTIIRDKVPFGRSVHEGRVIKFGQIEDLRCFRELKDSPRLHRSIGTLGGGNHYIEVDVDENGVLYLNIHTGSRNLGKQVADYYQKLACDVMHGFDSIIEKQNAMIAEYKATGRKSELQGAIAELRKQYRPATIDTPNDLCYLTGSLRDDYLHDMQICQQFAIVNREWISKIVLRGLGIDEDAPYFESVHNYIDLDTNIVRKGAIDASIGKKLVIPINMRDGCIIGVGKGNPDWNNSAPHGAGRLMSRTKAKATLSLVDYENSMSGIFTTSVGSETLDEAPMVYKPIDEILGAIGETVDVLAIVKPIYNFKASE